ncbi:MAG: polysaccharide biosynthesis C-terminal domain-containing protein [Alphaproteobacteria bacterium]|nr:polysaccharide biosynthesis C-terminal domain-containing protein [Alphaproteobacteria bacterium]
MRHVVVMAGTGAIGLIAVFAVDLLNLFYISLLGQRPIAAAVGFAGVVGFFQTSVLIGLAIGVGAVVARSIGAGTARAARHIAGSGLVLMVLVGLLVGLGSVALLTPILAALGASGETRSLAEVFLMISSPFLPLLAAGMCCSALLRCIGDARRAMNVTLLAAVATAVMDPILIFGLHLGLSGAAVSTVLSRCVLATLGWLGAARRHDLVARPSLRALAGDMATILHVAFPAVLTNLATPVGAAYVTRSMAAFGPDAVAGQATIGRISPVAFGLIYALSGAVGPILAQNVGAGRSDRVRQALRASFTFVLATVLVVWAILAAGQDLVVRAFFASGVTAELVHLFCSWLAAGFLFTGALFVANAAFNNLGYPVLATLFNWGRATLGTIPFVAYGARFGPAGLLVGQAAGSVIFGTLAVVTAFLVVGRLAGGIGQPGIGMEIPAGTGNTVLATLAIRPWLNRYLPLHRHTRSGGEGV